MLGNQTTVAVRRTTRTVILLIFTLSLVGCLGPSNRQLGEEAQATGRHEAAVVHYQRAIAKSPRLARDADFMRAFNLAKRDAHVTRARRAIDEQRWVVAYNEANSATALAPQYPPAIELRRTAAHGAADNFYAQAVRHADAGKLEDAAKAVTHALDYNPAHLRSLSARDALSGSGSPVAQAQSLYTQAVRLSAERRWTEAEAAFAQVINLDPTYFPARAQRHLAALKIKQADLLYEEARDLDKQKRLDLALEKLEAAKEIRPHHTGYDRAYESLLSRRTHAEQLMTQVTASIAAGRWDQGLATIEQVKTVFPHHPRLETITVELLGRAAIAHTQRGDRHYAAGKPDAARDAYNDALRYVPKHKPAHLGLAAIAHDAGRDAEAQRLWGHALLAYTEAFEHAADTASGEDLARARAMIVQDARFAVRFTPAAYHSADSARAESALIQALQREAPPYLAAQPLPADATPRRYQAQLSATLNRPVVTRVASQNHEHLYDVESIVPNPEVDVLRKKIHISRSRLADLRHDHRAHVQKLHRLEHQHAAEPDNDRLAHRIRSVRRDLDSIDHKMKRESRRLHDLEHALSCEPLQITVVERVGWPYTVETHRKTIAGSLRLNLVDTASGRAVQPITIDKDITEDDKLTLNANPTIGLPHNPLRFTDDGTLYQQLEEACTQAAAERLIGRLTLAESKRLRTDADRLAAAGQHAEALELRVAAATLLRWTHPQAAQTYINDLRQTASP